MGRHKAKVKKHSCTECQKYVEETFLFRARLVCEPCKEKLEEKEAAGDDEYTRQLKICHRRNLYGQEEAW